MMRSRLAALLLGVVVGMSPLLMAAVGGLPSRPRFQSIGLNASPPSALGRATLNTALVGDAVEFQQGGAARGYLRVDASGVGLYSGAGGTGNSVRVDGTGALVNGVAVCLANGTNCPAAPVETSGTFTITWDDACTVSPTTVVDWVAIGNMVTWVLRSTTGFPCTSDSTSFATTSAIVPVALRPAVSIPASNVFAGAQNNGTTGASCLTVFSTGTVGLSFVSGGASTCGAWTNSGQKSAASTLGTFTYILNNP
jgi:hypothetical protein